MMVPHSFSLSLLLRERGGPYDLCPSERALPSNTRRRDHCRSRRGCRGCRSRRGLRCRRVGVHCATSAFRVPATPIARYEPGTSCESLCESDSDISRSEGLALAIVSSSKNIIGIHVCVRSQNDTAFSRDKG